MKIYTKKGDMGATSLIGGIVVPKDDLIIEVIGEIDELNSILGIVFTISKDNETKAIIEDIQKTLFVIGSDLASTKSEPQIPRLSLKKVTDLEETIDNISKSLPSQKGFILPVGSLEASFIHFARAVCRRVERKIVSLAKKEKINEVIPIYINRLSDLLFILARKANYDAKVEDKIWR